MNMKLFAVGIDPVWISVLREHNYDAINCRVLPEDIAHNAIIVSSNEYSMEGITLLQEKYPNNEIIYVWLDQGISGWHTPAALCVSLGIRFIRPGIGKESFLEQMNAWFRSNSKAKNIIGIFGTMAGVGVTRIAATLAQMIATEKKVIMLGLNLYNAGWEGESTISMDRWRQRLIARVLQPEDLSNLVQVNGFRYLPGNEDILSALDYEENEIEHLLEVVEKEADVVIADFGSIPDSAAWFCGLQQSAIRVMVTQPSHTKRLSTLMKLSSDLGVSSEHWHVVSNRAANDEVSIKTIGQAHRMQPLLSIPYKGSTNQLVLPNTDRELESFKKSCQPILSAIGMNQTMKKGWF
jgi:MinD-like ATPase involved in chromosome partitioning or flagellar assembly